MLCSPRERRLFYCTQQQTHTQAHRQTRQIALVDIDNNHANGQMSTDWTWRMKNGAEFQSPSPRRRRRLRFFVASLEIIWTEREAGAS